MLILAYDEKIDRPAKRTIKTIKKTTQKTFFIDQNLYSKGYSKEKINGAGEYYFNRIFISVNLSE